MISSVEDAEVGIGFGVSFTGSADTMSPATSKVSLSSSKFLVLPSYYEFEAMPRVILEAMSLGLPCVVSDHAGIPDMVTEEFAELHFMK